MDCKDDPQGHVPRTKPTAAMSVWRAVALALILALVFGVTEVVIRFGLSGEPIITSRWSLALYVNVSLLGLAALAVLAGGQLLFTAATAIFPVSRRRRAFACLMLRNGAFQQLLDCLTGNRTHGVVVAGVLRAAGQQIPPSAISWIDVVIYGIRTYT